MQILFRMIYFHWILVDNKFFFIFFVPDFISKRKCLFFFYPSIRSKYFIRFFYSYPIIIFCLAHSYIVVNIWYAKNINYWSTFWYRQKKNNVTLLRIYIIWRREDVIFDILYALELRYDDVHNSYFNKKSQQNLYLNFIKTKNHTKKKKTRRTPKSMQGSLALIANDATLG